MNSQIFPASYHQERLWFIDNFENGVLYEAAPVYHNVPLILKIDKKLEEDLVKKSLFILHERHESLRTKILVENDEIVQSVEKEAHVYFKIHDKRSITNDEKQISDFYHGLINEPFSIDGQNLFKVDLIELADDLNTLIFVAHHIICDRKSMFIILEEFISIYNSLLLDTSVNLPELSVQYADYANWQKEFSEDTIEKLMIFWREKLSFIEPLIFHTDEVRDPIHIYEAGVITQKLPENISNDIKQFDENEYYVFLTAFEVLMHKYSGQSKVVIGTIFENREIEDLKSVVGPISNLIVLNNEVSKNETFQDTISLNKSVHQHSLNFAVLPFDKLVTELKPEKDMSRTALFDVLFHYEDHSNDNYKIGQTKPEIIETNLGLGKYDFNLLITKQQSGYFMHFTYNKLYYNVETAQRIINHYSNLLSNNNVSGLLVSDLQYVTKLEKEESQALLDKTNVNWPKEDTIVKLFEEQAHLHASKTAVIVENKEYLYQELNDLSNQFSDFLIKNYDVKPQDYVALLLPRNEKQIIAILAILKSGAVYVPIDKEYPEERVQYILDDCLAKVCIDDKIFLEFLESKQVYSVSNSNLIISPQDLAYVIYTSGSTGKPKGVMIEHRNVVRLFINDSPLFDFSENDVWTMFHSYCFDFSVWEIYGALLFGGSLVVIPKNIAIDANAFLDVLVTKGVTVLSQTPSAFYNLLTIKPWESVDKLALRYVVFGGEALRPVKLADWYKFYPDVKLINMYGITETTVHVTYKEITQQEVLSDVCNIGIPIPTLSCYILDEERRILPKLIPGELWVGGEGLARGYLGKQELTEERFILNPFGEGKLYSSGDIVRLLSNNEMEYIGRKDNQVKIRGFRIELGEIEKALLKNEEIEEAVVIVRGNQYGENELIAYFSSENKQNITVLSSFLKSVLPHFMLPSYYVQVDHFRLNNNGKIDKSVLPVVENNHLNSGVEYVAPGNPIEASLVEIWQEVLLVDKVGINDNFFELGGNSLLAFQVFNRISKKLGKSVPLKVFFENPVISDLSGHLKELLYVTIPNVELAESYPVTTSQHRFWVLSQLDGASLAYNMPEAITLNGKIDAEKFQESFQILIDRYEILRTYFKANEEGEVRQYIVPADLIDFKIDEKDFRGVADQDKAISNFMQAKSKEVFDLDKAPLLKVSMICVDDDRYIFFLSIHHIIGDGLSMKILVSEIIEIYDALIQGKTINLPELKIQYKDYAVWLNGEVKTNQMQIAAKYWFDQFSGELPVLELPSFKTRPTVQTYNGKNISYKFPKHFLENLQAFSKKHDATLFMTLMAGVKVLLHKYSSQTDLISGTSIAGRAHPDLENQIGLFLNLLAIRTQIVKEESFVTLLEREKQTLLQAYEHQSYSFDELVDKLNLKRSRNRSALFDVMIDLQSQNQANDSEAKESLKDFTAKGYGLEVKTSKFDIEFAFVETGDALALNIRFNTDIYDEAQMTAMFLHLENVFEQIANSPDILIQNIDYLSSLEKSRLLDEFNDTKVDLGEEKTVLELFKDQVLKTPDAAAVVFGSKRFTYQDLDTISSQLSKSLKNEYGIEKGDRVGIQLHRSEWPVIAILAVLKTGGVYVPIDSELPANRKAYIAEDTDLKLLITETSFILELDFYQGNVLSIDVEFEASADLVSIDNPDVTFDDLAYIIYTSGSTGQPKGVMVGYGSLSNYLLWAKNYYLHENLLNTNFGLFTSLSFDLTITSLFLPLISGGTLEINQGEQVVDLLQSYLASDISCIKLTPSHISVLGNLDISSANLEVAVVGGEELRREHIEILHRINPSIRIYNEYGPTETTVGCTVHEVSLSDDKILIGKPIWNTSIYILDEFKNLQTEGVVGEIYIGGSGLAHGYFNRADLTADKFILNPFKAGEKIYKTGDLGKWLPDGTIEYKGRIDDQVKIRGYRIELGEIERNISNYSSDIKQVVVMVKEVNNEQALVAYYVSEMEIDKSELRNYLFKNLPEYMVPGFYIEMESIPLNSNGKSDRKKLPGITGENLIKKEYVAPRNEIEENLVEIWKEILGTDEIGITDNFFELGGHSISGIKTIAVIQKKYNIKIDLVNLFREPTIIGLAEKIDNQIWYNNEVVEEEITDKIII